MEEDTTHNEENKQSVETDLEITHDRISRHRHKSSYRSSIAYNQETGGKQNIFSKDMGEIKIKLN
jgi:hypothetical protein